MEMKKKKVNQNIIIILKQDWENLFLKGKFIN